MRSFLVILVTGPGFLAAHCALPAAHSSVLLVKPINLSALNTDADEDDPFVCQDGLRLFYATVVNKRQTLMLTQRKNSRQNWPAGEPVEGPDPDTDNRSPFLTGDNHDLYFATKIAIRAPKGEAKPVENFDIVHSIKLLGTTQFTAPTPVQSVDTEADEMHPWITASGLEFYFSRKIADGWRVFVAGRPKRTGPFGEPKLIKELPPGFHHVTINVPGTAMYLQGPLANNRWGLFRSTRSSPRQPWGKPKSLDMLNDPEAPTGDTSPCLSRDNFKLYFSSDRKTGKGGRDLWVIDTRALVSS
jgi:hypothetical protein